MKTDLEKLREGIPHRNLVTGMTMCSAELLERAAIEIERLRAALEELTGACEVEFESDQTGDEPDDEPVGGGLDQEGKPDWMTITFGMIRRARAALT